MNSALALSESQLEQQYRDFYITQPKIRHISKHPYIEQFYSTLDKTYKHLKKVHPKSYDVFSKMCFYKLSAIREYVHHVDPLNPWETKDGYAYKSSYCGRKCKNDINLTRACLIFLKYYYQDDFYKQMKLLWRRYYNGKLYTPYDDIQKILSTK